MTARARRPPHMLAHSRSASCIVEGMPHLLVVDDHPSVRHFVSKAMTVRGWSVVTTSNVESAVEQLDSRTFDVILSDVVMPHASGFDLVQRLHERAIHVPVVLMTGYMGDYMRAQPPDRAALPPIILKPFGVSDLDAALRTAMSGKT